jgi:hypothetical protein
MPKPSFELDPAAVLDRANEFLTRRLFAANATVRDARSFRALLENLHARDLRIVTGVNAGAVVMVRAGILRSVIGTVMSVLDPADEKRGNRASIGQMLKILKQDPDVAAMLTKASSKRTATPTVASITALYTKLVRSDTYKRVRALRNSAVAHVLAVETVPTVEYSDIFAVEDEAEQLVAALHELFNCSPAPFIADRVRLEKRVKAFWDTYFAGLAANRCQGGSAKS